MASTVVRTAALTPAELHVIGLLSPEERRSILVSAGLSRQQQLNEELRQTMIDRVCRGEITPVQADPATGQHYAGVGQRITLPGVAGELEDMGRVPNYSDLHVFRATDGTLRVLASQEQELERRAAAA
jgi:hypothetical protein